MVEDLAVLSDRFSSMRLFSVVKHVVVTKTTANDYIMKMFG